MKLINSFEFYLNYCCCKSEKLLNFELVSIHLRRCVLFYFCLIVLFFSEISIITVEIFRFVVVSQVMFRYLDYYLKKKKTIIIYLVEYKLYNIICEYEPI